MRQRIELHTQHMRFQIALAENTPMEVVRWAITETSDQYSTQFKRALEAQQNLYRENDALQLEEMASYKQAWVDAKQVQVVCHREMMALANQRSEFIVRKTKLDAFAADVTIQKCF